MTLYKVIHDFQGLIAATVALTAAMIAYRGAMAKLSFDRVEADKRRHSEKLALLLRLRSAINGLTYNVNHIVSVLSGTDDSTEYKIRMLEKIFGGREFGAPTEIDEAWQRLDLLGQEQMNDLELIRNLTRLLNTQLWMGGSDTEGMVKSAKAVIFACGHLSTLLLEEIEIMRPGSAANSTEHAYAELMKDKDSFLYLEEPVVSPPP